VYLAAASSGLTRIMSNRGGIALSNGDAERPAHPSHASPWGNSIWNTTNTTPLGGFGFGSTRRDSSRPRGTHVAPAAGRNTSTHTDTRPENGSYDLTDGKTGSGSLVADSETEWRPTRPSWADAGTSSNPHARSSGVSPARKRSIVQTQPSQPFPDASTSSFFTGPRASIVGAGSLSNPPKPHLDPTSTNFTSSLNNNFHGFGFGQTDTSQRPDTGVTSWPDTASVHSPNDDRRSTAASEYFASSSGAPSRNGSLPPSRHGAEPAQYAQHIESFARLSQAAPRQSTSFSYANGRPFQERSGSIQSESFHTLNRMALEQDQDARLPHRQSFSTNGLATNYTHSGPDTHIARDSYPDTQLPVRALDQSSQRNGTYTPDSFASGQVSDPNVQFQSFQFNTQSAPNGTGARQSPFYSQTHTPPVYDRLNPYTSEQTLSHPNNFALVQNKLAGYQNQQERRNYVPHTQFQQQQYQHILPSAQLRHPYPYQFSAQNVMPISSLPPHMAMVNMSPMFPQQPPRGPKEQQASDGTAVLGLKLVEFRREAKTSKRWELTDIYDDVVEFAGDQHGSRFIQQKLETANSEVKEKIFKELESNSLQLMQDVFGNYVIQKFFEHGDQTQKRILASKMKGHVSALANQMYACRVVQKVCFPHEAMLSQTNPCRHSSTFSSTNKRPWSRNSRRMS
jgi:mRNA-binding protein PUF3